MLADALVQVSGCVVLSFFEKLVLCRGLQFAIPQPTSPRDIQASFEKAYWKLEPLLLSDSKKDLASATLRSIALNYIASRDPKPPKALLQAINNLKRREDIITAKPDKGSGVVVMGKTDYLRLLHDASIRDSAKFIECSNERPKTRGRPPKHYHPLLKRRMNFTPRYTTSCQNQSLILSALKGQDLLICMVYPRPTSLNCP